MSLSLSPMGIRYNFHDGSKFTQYDHDPLEAELGFLLFRLEGKLRPLSLRYFFVLKELKRSSSSFVSRFSLQP